MADIKQIKIGETTYDINAKTADRASKMETYTTPEKTTSYGGNWQLAAYWETNSGPIRIASDQNESTYNVKVDEADKADVATKLGTTTVGSSSEPIYIKDGVPTKCNITTIAVFG